MLLLKKKNHISSLQNHQISIFVSLDPHYSLPEIFENPYCHTTNEKAKRKKRKRKKETRLTYQAAPKTETPTESAMPIAENTKGDM